MDFYTVIFIDPRNGNRYVFEGIQAEIHNRHEFATAKSTMGFQQKFPTKTWLDIILTIPTPSDTSQIKKFRDETITKDLLLHFKDIHPNLIKGVIKSITMDYKNVGIMFKGNVTDKEYLDYVTEVSNQLQAYQTHFKVEEPDFSNEPETKEPIAERKVTVIKRKLTF